MMGISMNGDEDDTRTVITMVLVSGEERERSSAPRRSVGGCANPAPRDVLFYTLLELFQGTIDNQSRADTPKVRVNLLVMRCLTRVSTREQILRLS
jgi:hypothetical protein